MSQQNNSKQAQSKQTNSLSRRNFLKGAAYTSALSIGGLSSVAFAACGNSKTGMISASTSTVTLFNQSDKTVTLNGSTPVSLEKLNGWVVLKINKGAPQSLANISAKEVITLGAGEKLAFEVDSELAPMLKETGDYIVITNEYSALNNLVPITTYDAMVA